MAFTIVSFYTVGTVYAEVAHQYLMPSIQKLQLKSDIRGILSLGSWQKNTSYKPKFILEMLDHGLNDLVFVDSDATITTYPELFDKIPSNFDFAVHTLDKNAWYGLDYGQDKYELLTGTLFVRNNQRARKILNLWIQNCENTTMWEQRVLQNLVEEYEIPIYPLPLGYCYINSLPDGTKPRIKIDNPTIIHHQVSRKYKNLV